MAAKSESEVRRLMLRIRNLVAIMSPDEIRSLNSGKATPRPAHVVLANVLINEISQFDKANSRLGRWFPTYSGWRYWPLDPRPGDFNIEDIAHSLAGTCRFNAHCEKHYSVAQHSVLMSEHALGFEFLSLMHDGPEGLLHDIATPVKRLIGHQYEELTNRCWSAMKLQYGIDDSREADLKELDHLFLHTEARDNFPYGMVADGVTWGGECFPNFSIQNFWSRDYAKERFLERFRELRPASSMQEVSGANSEEADRIEFCI